jgi:hypothetical protein
MPSQNLPVFVLFPRCRDGADLTQIVGFFSAARASSMLGANDNNPMGGRP